MFSLPNGSEQRIVRRDVPAHLIVSEYFPDIAWAGKGVKFVTSLMFKRLGDTDMVRIA
jgi:hypothetical protein